MDEEEKIIITIIVAIFIGFISLAFYSEKTKCLTGYEAYQPQWGMIVGCRIMVDGKLTPTDIARELSK